MEQVIEWALVVVFLNAFVAALVTFYWQFIVIMTIHQASNHYGPFSAAKSLGDQRSFQNMFGRFIAGEFEGLAHIRRKWSRSWFYTIISIMLLFGLAAITELLYPDVIG